MEMNLKTTYLSLGSNIGDKVFYLQSAIFAIDNTIGDIKKISPIYQSSSWGFDSDNFMNICLSIKTTLQPQELLNKILEIEDQLGRKRSQKAGYEPRTIDIDILYYEKEIVTSDTLVIPHPTLTFRNFVLRPLADIAPQFYHPLVKKDTRNLLQECKDDGKIEKTSYQLFKDKASLFSRLNFIAIEGNIGAGKTTLARKIAEDFNGKLILERYADNPFLPKFYRDQSRYAFPLEMSFLADRYQQFSDDISQYDLFKNFMVSDYDIYKSLIFAQITLPEEEFKLYRKLFNLMYNEVKKPKIYVYLHQHTERLLENIKKRGRDYEQNINADYLESINKGYFKFLKCQPKKSNLIIELGDLDFVADKKDYEIVIDKIIKFAIHLPHKDNFSKKSK